MPVTSSSGLPMLPTASAMGRTRAAGTEMSTLRASMLESAVLAVPEPMLASSRSASSWRSVYWVLNGRGPFSFSDRQEDVGDRVAVDDEGDLAVREDRRAGERGAVGDLGGQGPGDQLV